MNHIEAFCDMMRRSMVKFVVLKLSIDKVGDCKEVVHMWDYNQPQRDHLRGCNYILQQKVKSTTSAVSHSRSHDHL